MAVSVIGIGVSAIDHTHIHATTSQRIVNSRSAGSHQHPTEYDTNGNAIGFTTCYMRVDTYEISKICGICNQAYSTSTSNVVVHSAVS